MGMERGRDGLVVRWREKKNERKGDRRDLVHNQIWDTQIFQNLINSSLK